MEVGCGIGVQVETRYISYFDEIGLQGGGDGGKKVWRAFDG